MANIIVNPGAIDKLQSDVGDVSNLTTSAKNSLVAAVNEHEGDITSLNSNITNGHLVAKYLNDTSKTAIQLLTADFSNVNLGDIQFYRIRPSDDNLYGFIVKHSATYAYGLFAGMNTGDSYNIVNSNGTWTKEKLALNSSVTKSTYTDGGNPVVLTIRKFGSICVLTYNNTTISLASGWRTLSGLIPNDYKPAGDVAFPCFCGASRNIPCIMNVKSNGDIEFYNTSSSNQSGVFAATATYVC